MERIDENFYIWRELSEEDIEDLYFVYKKAYQNNEIRNLYFSVAMSESLTDNKN